MTNTQTVQVQLEQGVGIWHNEEWHYFFYETEQEARTAEILLRILFNPYGHELSRITKCKDDNHSIDAEANIGPDHGAEYLYCRRCDWSHSITYY